MNVLLELKQKLELYKKLNLAYQEATSQKNEIQIDVEKTLTMLNSLENDNDDCYDSLYKISSAKFKVKLFTALYNLSLILTFIITISTGAFLDNFLKILIALGLLTVSYVVGTAESVSYLQNNKSSFYKRRIRKNNKKIKKVKQNLAVLNNDLQNATKITYKCKKDCECCYMEIISSINTPSNVVVERDNQKKKVLGRN